MVMAQVLFKLLRQQHPDAGIDVLAPTWSRPILVRMPEVRRAIDLPFGHGEFAFGKRRALGKQLADTGYDQAIVLPNSWKSGLVSYFADIPQRTGWRGEMRYGLLNDLRPLDKTRYPLMIERFAALAFARDSALPDKLPWPQFSVRADDIDSALAAMQIDRPTTPVLALCPGAEFGPAKRWPDRHYAAVANHYLDQGWQVWLFGSAKDRDVTTLINAACADRCVDLSGRTSLAQAIDLMSLATQVVSNDSGLMHVAAALQRPLVVPYGSSSPKFTPPLSEQVRILQLDLPCSPCFKRECPLGHLNCLNQLAPSQVLNAIRALQPRLL
ncbi:lipopolysaccharide heptosyltransferase II [Permianibacter fluminis]|uniref:lipopolysaccharide heptosyltransferase II n=1 Tax=Permianibacter fluminis TaxID=2738515 RepID=UPI001B7D8DCF